MKKSTFHLFVFDTMSDWEYGYLVAGINNPQFQKTPGRFRVKTVALSGEPIATMGGPARHARPKACKAQAQWQRHARTSWWNRVGQAEEQRGSPIGC